MFLKPFQVSRRERFSVCGVNGFWFEIYHLVPRIFVLLQVLNPDDCAFYAGEIVHGGIATEQYSVFEKAYVIGRMARSLNYLEWKFE